MNDFMIFLNKPLKIALYNCLSLINMLGSNLINLFQTLLTEEN